MNRITCVLGKWFVGETAPDVNPTPKLEQLIDCHYAPSPFRTDSAQGSIAVELGGAVAVVGLAGDPSMGQAELDRYGKLFAAAPTMMEALHLAFPVLGTVLSELRKKERLTETELHDLELISTALAAADRVTERLR